MRFRIEGGPKVEDALNRLLDLAHYAEQHGRLSRVNDQVWDIAAELYEAATGGEILPGYEGDTGQNRKSYTDDQDRDSYTVST